QGDDPGHRTIRSRFRGVGARASGDNAARSRRQLWADRRPHLPRLPRARSAVRHAAAARVCALRDPGPQPLYMWVGDPPRDGPQRSVGDTGGEGDREGNEAMKRCALRGGAFCGVALCGGGLWAAASASPPPAIYGFTSRSSAAERSIERRFVTMPSPARAREAHAFLTAEPHVAGTPRDRLLAEWVRDRWKEYGLARVRYAVPYSYRGFKALTAEQRGAAGLLIYSDPAEDGFRKGRTYPDGPWGNESHIQRGGTVYDFRVPGDPLTPGWASLPGAK